MKSEVKDLLNMTRLPGRLDAMQASSILGFQVHDVPVLVRKGLIKPLGNPGQNAVKYFATTEIEEYAKDPKWLSKATSVISNNWKNENEKRRGTTPDASLLEHQKAA